MKQVVDKAVLIAAINDRFRETYWGGKVMMTQGVSALPDDLQLRIFRAVSDFDDFTEDNDPHGEHDFGRVIHDGLACFWKIDYYDHTLCYGSEDASNTEITTRVLTIMLASDIKRLRNAISTYFAFYMRGIVFKPS